MSKDKSAWNKLKKQVSDFFNDVAQNKIVFTADNSELDFYELGEDDTPAVGDKAKYDGKPAGDSNDGEYTMPSGEIYKFTGEELTEIVPKESDTEDLVAENEALKTEVENLKTEIKNLKSEKGVINKKLSDAKAIITNFQKLNEEDDENADGDKRDSKPNPDKPSGSRGANALKNLKNKIQMVVTNNFTESVVELVDSFTNADMLDFNQAIVNDIVVDNEIEKEKNVLYGVKNGDVVPIIEKNDDYTMFPVADESECGTEECDLDVNFSGVKWDLALIKCKVPICLNKFDKEFLAFWNTYRKFDENPDLDQALLQYLGGQFKQGLENAKWRRAYFADQASTSPLLDGSDGFWIKADASATVGENKIEITKNNGGTAAAQRMTFEEIYELLSDMYELATQHTWFDPSTFRFELPWTMGLTYMNGLNKLGHHVPANCQCLSADGIVKAGGFTLENIGFAGMPMKVFRAFDGVINQVPELNGNSVAGASKVSPNRALLVKNENMLIGSSDENQLTFFKIWHNEDDEKIYMRGGSYIGAAFPKVNELILAI